MIKSFNKINNIEEINDLNMLTTAKSFQLLDASGINISPVTDITSLYYEIEKENSGTPIITRKYVYSGFPVAVNIDSDVCTNIGKINDESYEFDSEKKYYKIVDSSNQDIIISNISTSIIPGTTYRQFDIKNYNLTEILKSYTTREMFDASIENIDTSLYKLDTSIQNLYDSLKNDNYTLDELLHNILIPNKFYIINNYFYQDNRKFGCMSIPLSGIYFHGPSKHMKLLVKAFDTSSLDGKLYEMFDSSYNRLHVHGNYVITDNDKIKITYLKDDDNNEATYDFKNLLYRSSFHNTYVKTFTNIQEIKNNIIKINPFISGIMPCFIGNINSSNIVENNYIGSNTSLFLQCDEYGKLVFRNNIIMNDNDISINCTSLNIQNTVINNNNFISSNINNEIIYKNLYINNNNNIKIYNQYQNINNLIINSSNDITIKTNSSVNNITVLNNCNGEILIKSNTIIDNVQQDFEPNENSVYLFNQNIYAGSFNVFK